MDIEELFKRSDDPQEMTPERRILVATLDCIAEQGLEGATVRVIAAKAGLNAAAVNYYYRTKERLVEAALRSAWTHVSEDIDRIAATAKDGGEGFEMTVSYLIEGAYKYPAIIRAIIVEHPSLRGEAGAFFKKLFEELYAKTDSPGPASLSGQAGGPEATTSLGRARGDPGLGTALLLALAAFIGLAPETLSALAGRDLGDPVARRALAAEVTPRIFPNPRGSSP
ncbi:MAG TPA: TetR/AcrR family transcriptional regulator [Rectinemataceae bacterium]|nr:TetR/AcrR family transcriptional regulator [Rectinemataceae bacterium]